MLVSAEEVYGPNLALNRPTFLYNGSPTHSKYISSTAVDGSPWTTVSQPLYCASYRGPYKSGGLYLRVDLDREYPISHVEVTPATDGRNGCLNETNL